MTYFFQYDYMLKLCLLGESEVGKTNLMTMFTTNDFDENYNKSIGIDFRLKTLDCILGKKVKYKMWDSSGDINFR